MKAIVSHDIDHLTLSEHYLKDLVVLKYFMRNNIELLTDKISFKEFFNRIADVLKDKWQYIVELHEFNKEHKVPTTYFIGVNKGIGLSYSKDQSLFWIRKMLEMGCDVGLHGVEFECLDHIKSEYEEFKEFSQLSHFGTRMHYIRTNETTLQNMAKVGYHFDSSEMSFHPPYKIGSMWEFPFQIMDGYIIEKPRQWQSKNFEQSCEETKKIIDKAIQLNLPYLGIDFHDRYFSDRHKTWKDWYMWLIEYLSSNKIEFVNFRQAITELEANILNS